MTDRVHALLRRWIVEQKGDPWVEVPITDDAGYVDDQYWVCAMCDAERQYGKEKHGPACIWPELEQIYRREREPESVANTPDP